MAVVHGGREELELTTEGTENTERKEGAEADRGQKSEDRGRTADDFTAESAKGTERNQTGRKGSDEDPVGAETGKAASGSYV
jgi:hypothetical protein